MAGWVCLWGHAWLRESMAGVCAWQGGLHGGGMCGWGVGMHGKGACVAGERATAAEGTHLTGMHSCFTIFPAYSVQLFVVFYLEM